MVGQIEDGPVGGGGQAVVKQLICNGVEEAPAGREREGRVMGFSPFLDHRRDLRGRDGPTVDGPDVEPFGREYLFAAGNLNSDRPGPAS